MKPPKLHVNPPVATEAVIGQTSDGSAPENPFPYTKTGGDNLDPLDFDMASNPKVDATAEQATAMRAIMRVQRLLRRVRGENDITRFSHLADDIQKTATAISESADVPVKLKDLGVQTKEIEREIALKVLIPDARNRLMRAARNSIIAFALVFTFGVLPFLYPDLQARISLPPLVFSLVLVASGVLLGRFVTFLAMHRSQVTDESEYYVTLNEIPSGLGPIRDIAVAGVVFLILNYEIVTLNVGLPIPAASGAAAQAEQSVFANGARNAAIFVLGFLTGLIIPAVVDRLRKTASQLFAESADQA